MNGTSKTPAPVLVTGASGYIGGRLVPRLLAAGHRVRCLARSPRKLAERPWARHPGVEIVQGDVSSEADVERALSGCSAAYYLVHSMLVAGADYARRDRELAATFARGAARAGIERIVYLGGLGETGVELSEHLSSRREVETQLASTGVPLTVLRAAMILGAGSASFEILRYLVERLPVMVTPRWVGTRCQPIAVDDVLEYLVRCLDVPETAGRELDVGGPDVLSYREIMQLLADERGLRRRWIVPVRVLTPRLSSLWIHLVTPVSASIARPLAEGLRNEVVCRDDEAQRWIPMHLTPVREALRLALRNLGERTVETTWSDAGPMPGDPDWAGGSTFVDSWSVDVAAPPERVFAAVCRVGGGHGWYAADWLWRVRGQMDRAVGGPGLRRGRRDPDAVRTGDALDFWRVVDVVAPSRLELAAEMKLPGVARLEFELTPDHRGGTRLVQTARFAPRGLLGLLYWYAVKPLHGPVFRGMLRGVQRSAEGGGAEGGGTEGEPAGTRRAAVVRSRAGNL